MRKIPSPDAGQQQRVAALSQPHTQEGKQLIVYTVFTVLEDFPPL